MARRMRVTADIAILPVSYVSSVDRDVDVSRCDILVIYPDATKGSELDEIIKATQSLAETKRGTEES